MTSPRRLWTGDWEQDSALRAEELAARRRARVDEPVIETAEPVVEARPSLAARVLAPLRAGVLALVALLRGGARALRAGARRTNTRVAAFSALGIVLIVGIAFGLNALFGGSGGSSNPPVSSAAVTEAERWLGVQLVPLNRGGVVIETVNQSGAGAAAGLEPGDVISQIDNRSIFSIDDAARAIDGLNPGAQALITVNRGSTIYSTSFPMPPRPGGP
jgi:hypothetical protein